MWVWVRTLGVLRVDVGEAEGGVVLHCHSSVVANPSGCPAFHAAATARCDLRTAILQDTFASQVDDDDIFGSDPSPLNNRLGADYDAGPTITVQDSFAAVDKRSGGGGGPGFGTVSKRGLGGTSLAFGAWSRWSRR